MSSLPTVTTGSDARGPLYELSAADCSNIEVVTALEQAGAKAGEAVWVDHPAIGLDEAMLALGLAAQRDLWLMEVDLPLSAAVLADTTAVVTRPFEIGRDESAWVEVNNRAFAWHREQGGWTVDDLVEREGDDWFDPDGFLLHEVDGELAGFCWTKPHPDATEPAGEIYVVGVDPKHHGKGLGQSMSVAGLVSIHVSGFDRGILYVDADNIAAARLYEKLGFRPHTIRRLYS
ncbi:MAG: mycothiol synthase [Actinobacteria bacterium]|nr:mycothiol synthase [Actinomycetota bacterium]